MRGQIHSWIAVVAVLAVTLLGAVAINRSASERDRTTRAAVVSLCERQNVGRYQIDVEFARLDSISSALAGALRIAQGEQGQALSDRLAYARLQALIDSSPKPRQLPLYDCQKELLP